MRGRGAADRTLEGGAGGEVSGPELVWPVRIGEEVVRLEWVAQGGLVLLLRTLRIHILAHCGVRDDHAAIGVDRVDQLVERGEP